MTQNVSASSPRLLLAWGWTLVILVLCWTPSDKLPLDKAVPSFFAFQHLDKLVHFGIFAVFGVVWMRAVTSPGRAAWVLAGGIALAVVSEVGQGLSIIARDPDVFDALADAVGVAAGVWAYLRAARSG